jgi:hypothetical protein
MFIDMYTPKNFTMKKNEKVRFTISRKFKRLTRLAQIRGSGNIGQSKSISEKSLVTCLEELQQQGYIYFFPEERFIYLTEAGKRAQ